MSLPRPFKLAQTSFLFLQDSLLLCCKLVQGRIPALLRVGLKVLEVCQLGVTLLLVLLAAVIFDVYNKRKQG